MKAAICTRYGPPGSIVIREVAQPVPKETEILVAVQATTVTSADWRQRAGDFPGAFQVLGRLAFGLRGPRRAILGGEFAGTVVAAGAMVTEFRPGDAVFGFAGTGAHAEFLAIEATGPVLRKPGRLNFADAAAIPFGALTALVFLRDIARLRPGERVLVVGASGGVGVSAVQIAGHLGAVVEGVCGSANVDLVRDLGATRVFDRHAEPFQESGEIWDVILDTVGATSFAQSRRVLTPSGRLVSLEFGLSGIIRSLATSWRGGRRALVGMSPDRKADLKTIAGLVESGALRPVIDSRYDLADLPAAHARAESRRKRGSVVVTIGAAAERSLAPN